MKKTIILIHGIRGTRHGLSFVARELSRKYKVITPDLPGSGTRAELKNKSLDGYIEWLHVYIQNLHLKQKPYIIGHSMGSMVVSHFVEKCPDDVQGEVILMAPVFRKKINQFFSTFWCNVLVFILNILPKKTAYNIMRSKILSYIVSHYLTYDKTQQKRIDQLHYRYSGRFSSADSIIADIKISMQQQTIIPSQKHNLLIVGDKDKLTSYELVRKYSKRKNTKLKLIKSAGHLINYERPQEVAQYITEFIN